MKNTINRTLALLLATLTLVLCLAACGGGKASTDFSFKTADGVSIVIGAEADAIIEKLGNWVSQNSSASCGGFQGNDYIYTYHGFRVSTTPAKNGQIICKVELIDDSFKTPEGLYIGMSRTDAEAAMKGFTAESVGGNLVYTAGDTKLQVVFRDDAVSGIVYVAK